MSLQPIFADIVTSKFSRIIAILPLFDSFQIYYLSTGKSNENSDFKDIFFPILNNDISEGYIPKCIPNNDWINELLRLNCRDTNLSLNINQLIFLRDNDKINFSLLCYTDTLKWDTRQEAAQSLLKKYKNNFENKQDIILGKITNIEFVDTIYKGSGKKATRTINKSQGPYLVVNLDNDEAAKDFLIFNKDVDGYVIDMGMIPKSKVITSRIATVGGKYFNLLHACSQFRWFKIIPFLYRFCTWEQVQQSACLGGPMWDDTTDSEVLKYVALHYDFDEDNNMFIERNKSLKSLTNNEKKQLRSIESSSFKEFEDVLRLKLT